MRISYSCWILLFASVAVVHFGFLAIPAVATTSSIPREFDDRCIIDITHPLRDDMPSFGSPTGAGKILNETIGTCTVTGTFKIGTHLGTHVDAPSHIFIDQLEQGVTVDSLKLSTLIGPVLVVQTPDDTNIDAQVLDSLKIPKGVKRVIFKTSNTKRKLMDQQAFAENYIGFTADGAQQLVEQTDIIFVGNPKNCFYMFFYLLVSVKQIPEEINFCNINIKYVEMQVLLQSFMGLLKKI